MAPGILIKFEAKSSRVKGLSFHPKRKWILASLHNGVIQLWDYSEKTMIDKFDEHKGPVRGLDFHKRQPLFVSGGDDAKIKVWNYKLRRCIFTLDSAHEDYIRSTFFHPVHPWIISSSDDQSIRIWNWQSRSRIAVLTGHTHYVMCAQFHPTSPLILSASIDQTLRLWDITALEIKNTASSEPHLRSKEDLGAGLPEILTKTDYTVESKAAHMSEISWCAFHPNQPLCLSAADDNYIKVWRPDSRSGLSELYVLRGHYNNVNCAVFHPTKNLILSASEDRSIKVWDIEKRYALMTHKRDVDRFWTVAAHPKENLFAAGHDSGLLVFKIEKERPKALVDADKITSSIATKLEAKRVVISNNKKYIAAINGCRISLYDAQYNLITTITEQRKIKSAAWDEGVVLLYNTPVHVKYALTDGHSTTIVSVEETLYIKGIRDNKVFCIDRSGRTKQIVIDSREFRFKQAVLRNDRNGILSTLRELNKLSETEIAFLVKKGYPGLALKFVKDAHKRFPLALQAFDIDDALESAAKIDSKRCWEQLAEAAMQIGHVRAAEKAYTKLKMPYKLAMLYLICGQKDKMSDARALAKNLGDLSTEFVISLLMKDFSACARIIKRCGHSTLAYACAVNHGLSDLAMEFSADLTEEQLMLLPPLESASSNSSWMQTTIPEIKSLEFENWPLLNDTQENFEAVLEADEASEIDADSADNGDWEEYDAKDTSEKDDKDLEELEDDGENGWSEDEELLDYLAENEDEDEKDAPASFVPPKQGKSMKNLVQNRSEVALHHVLVGSFKKAFELLRDQVGAINPEPLKAIFEDLYLQSKVAYQGHNLFPTQFIHKTFEGLVDEIIPSGGYRIEDLEKRLVDSHATFSKGKFDEVMVDYKDLLLRTLFLQALASDSRGTSEERIKRAEEIRTTCREYILGLRILSEIKNIEKEPSKDFEDHKRVCELAAYFAKLNIRPRSRVLEKAFKVFCSKPDEFHKTQAAVSIARRLQDHIGASHPRRAQLIRQAEKIISNFDPQTDQQVKLDYDDKNPYSLCASTFKPIFKGNQQTECPLCDTKYKPEFNGDVCKVCLLSQVGKECSGVILTTD